MSKFQKGSRMKKLIEEGYKYDDLVRPTHSSLIIRSEGMEPREYDSLSDTASDIGILRQNLAYAQKHKKPISTQHSANL